MTESVCFNPFYYRRLVWLDDQGRRCTKIIELTPESTLADALTEVRKGGAENIQVEKMKWVPDTLE